MSGNCPTEQARSARGALRAAGRILLGVVSYLVDTPKEKVIKGTHAILQATVARDKTILAANLHPNATLAGWRRQQIIDGAVQYADQFGLKSATITGTEIKENPGMITVTMRVIGTFQSQKLPYDNVPTDWQLDWWGTTNGKWLLKDITPIGSGNLKGDQMSRQYFSK